MNCSTCGVVELQVILAIIVSIGMPAKTIVVVDFSTKAELVYFSTAHADRKSQGLRPTSETRIVAEAQNTESLYLT